MVGLAPRHDIHMEVLAIYASTAFVCSLLAYQTFRVFRKQGEHRPGAAQLRKIIDALEVAAWVFGWCVYRPRPTTRFSECPIWHRALA